MNILDALRMTVGAIKTWVDDRIPTSGSGASDMVVVKIDENTHKVTATITDGTITSDKLATELQDVIGQGGTNIQIVSWEADD